MEAAMKNRSLLILVGIISVVAFFIAACNIISSPTVFDANEKTGNVTVSFSGLSGRTLWPSALDFDRYKFTFINEADEYIFTEDENSSGSFTFLVPEGQGYSLNVKAYKVVESIETLAAEGNTDEPFIVSVSTTVTIRLRGNPLLAEDDGTFSFTIQYPVGAAIDRLVLVYGNGDEEDLLIGAVLEDDGLTETMSNSIDVPAGWYGLELDINDGHKIAYYDDIVSIFSNTTTFYGTELNPIVFEDRNFSATILILQANTYGNQNTAIGSGLQRSAVELYNSAYTAIDLSAGNYYLHIGTAAAWTHVIKLEGIIPSKCSFLVATTNSGEINATPPALFPVPDLESDFEISNSGFKIAVLTDQAAPLSVNNPFTEAGLAADYVDMLGVLSGTAAEGSPFLNQSRPRVPRRWTLTDTDNNAADFRDVDYRNPGIPFAELYKYWPRNSSMGAWDPISGEPRMDPKPFIPPPPMDGEIKFSKSAGLYQAAFDLELTIVSPLDGAVIRYTIDGEDPTSSSPVYSTPLPMNDHTSTAQSLSQIENIGGGYVKPAPGTIFNGTVVKAQLFTDAGVPVSPVYINSYFVKADIFTKYKLPVVSISTPKENFFDNDTGIYVTGSTGANFSETGGEWERPAFFEMFEKDGTRVVSQGMGVRIHGSASRNNPQKTLRFYARTGTLTDNLGGVRPVLNGRDSVDYDLFQGAAKNASGEPITSGFKRFLLRASGNDAIYSFLRDPLGAVLADDYFNVDTMPYRPVVAFLNGEFWGLYDIRERFDDEYLAQHYGGSKNSYTMLERANETVANLDQGTEDDLDFYFNRVADVRGLDMTLDENYEFVKTIVDEDSIMDDVIIMTFLGDRDWGRASNNNTRIWRYKGPPDGLPWHDGRYRWMVYDTDLSLGYLNEGHDADFDSITWSKGGGVVSPGPINNVFFFSRLMDNEKFREKFVNRYMDCLNTCFSADVTNRVVTDLANGIDTAIKEQKTRWIHTLAYGDWLNEINMIKTWLADRVLPTGGIIANGLVNYAGTSQIALLTLKNDANDGYIRLNGMDLNAGFPGVTDPADWTGNYFVGHTQVIEAVANPGKVFSSFIITKNAGGALPDHMDILLELPMIAGGYTVTAVYE